MIELTLRARQPTRYRDRAALEISTDGRPSAERLAANRQPPTAEVSDALATVARAARAREQEGGGE